MTEDTTVPYRFEGTVAVARVVSTYGHLETGEESGDTVRVAGRVMLLRVQGKLAFATLRDWTGEVQLFCLQAVTDRFDELKRLNLGDWIGADGEVVRTKRGELSVKVTSWSLLARALHGFGDKWRGVNDPEVRYRQREVDLWANEGVRDRFLLRSRVVTAIRSLLAERGYVEVETPVLHPIPGGGFAKPFVTHYNSMHSDFYLRIALELYLKRCVVGGLERVFEVGRVFRNEGVGPKYNPEFTMLEAYQAYADYHDMAELQEYLISGAALAALGSTKVVFQGRELDLTPPWRKATLEEVVEEVTGVEVSLGMGRESSVASPPRWTSISRSVSTRARCSPRSTRRRPNRTSGVQYTWRTIPSRSRRSPASTARGPVTSNGSRRSRLVASSASATASSSTPSISVPASRPRWRTA